MDELLVETSETGDIPILLNYLPGEMIQVLEVTIVFSVLFGIILVLFFNILFSLKLFNEKAPPKLNLDLTNDEIVQHLRNSFLENKSNINFKNIAIDNKNI